MSDVWQDVTDFGARGDGQSDDTEAIRRAVEAAAGGHGGTVYFPPGVFLCGRVELPDHVTLRGQSRNAACEGRGWSIIADGFFSGGQSAGFYAGGCG